MDSAMWGVVLVVLMLIYEPAIILASLMQVSVQKSTELQHVKTKGVAKRRKQLHLYAAVTVGLSVIALMVAYRCWKIYTAPVNYDLAAIPEDPSDGLVVAAVACCVFALAGCVWLLIIRAKLKAIRQISNRIK